MLTISLDFLKSLADLPPPILRKVPKTIQLLIENPELPSLKLEPLATSALYSVRVDEKYRAILNRNGPDLFLLHVAPHDGAYRWAEKHSHAPSSVDLPVSTQTSKEAPPLALTPPSRVTPKSTSPVGGLGLEHRFHVGRIYGWHELRQWFEWDDEQHGYYLIEKRGAIICACLRADLNPSAPWEILVGNGPAQRRKAELLSRQSDPIPVFVKLAVDQWEYWGRFRVERLEQDINRFRESLPANRLADTSCVLYLADVG